MDIEVAICEAGKRFFWCVRSVFECEPLAYGYADTRIEAEEKMWAHAGIQARLHSTTVPSDESEARIARWLKKELWRERELRDTGEVVYTDYCSDFDASCSSSTWSVVKKTAKRVFVRSRTSSTVYALDREKLESEGWAKSKGEWFYTEPWEARHAEEIAEAQRRCEEREQKRQELLDSVTPDELKKIEEVFDGLKVDLADKIELFRKLDFGSLNETSVSAT